MILSWSRIASAETLSNDSAHSPACSTNASPREAAPRAAFNARASPANTRGGWFRSSFRARSSAPGSPQSGCWAAGSSRHDSGDQGLVMGSMVARPVPTCRPSRPVPLLEAPVAGEVDDRLELREGQQELGALPQRPLSAEDGEGLPDRLGGSEDRRERRHDEVVAEVMELLR